MDRRDEDGTQHRLNRRADDDAGETDGPVAAGAETGGTTATASGGLRPLPPMPARFDRSQRLPAQIRPASQPPQAGPASQPPQNRPPQNRPAGQPYPPSSVPPPRPPTGSGQHGAVDPVDPGDPGEPARTQRHDQDEPREASAEEMRDLRVRKIDESLTRMTAAHAGLPMGVGATARRDDADPAEDLAEHARTPTKTRRRVTRTCKILAFASAAILFVLAATGWGTKRWLDSQIREVAALDAGSDAIINPAAQAGDENFLLVGSDTRPGAQRSDSIMVAHVPADGSRAVVVSFPRSLEVDRPACQRWDQATATYRADQVTDEPRTKLSATYDTGGPRCLTKVIQKLSGLSITRFIGMDFAGVRDMVDAANGVEVCVEKPVIDGVLGAVVPNAGTSKIDGSRALDFVRARNVRGDPTDDSGQIQRQQSLLAALLRAAASNHVALDPTAVRNVVSGFARNGVADKAGVDELILLAQSLLRPNAAPILFRTAPTAGQLNSSGNEVLRDADATALFTALRDHANLPDTPAVSGAAPSGSNTGNAIDSGVQPKDVRVEVRNASDRAGLAAQVGSSLGKLSFAVASVGNADTPADRTVIRYSPDQQAQAKVLAAVVPDAAMQVDESGKGTLQLVLGANFDGIVSPLAANGGVPDPNRAAAAGPATQTATCR